MTQYSRGADFERKVKADLQKQGWFAYRIAGSRGPVDVLAHDTCGNIANVQCKLNGVMPIQERRDFENYSRAGEATPILAFKDDDGKIKYSEIKGDTYIDWDPSYEDVARGAVA
jgi:Holliday junction resolvase